MWKLEPQCVGYIAGLQVTAIVEDLHGDLLDRREGHTRLLERVRHLGHGVAGRRVGRRAQLPGRGIAVLAYGTMKQGWPYYSPRIDRALWVHFPAFTRSTASAP